MKLFSSLPKYLLLAALFVGVTSAASGDLRNWMDNLSSDIPFWYLSSQKISVSQITSGKVIISSPVIEDELGNQIKKYTAMYSERPLSDILEDTNLLSQSKEKTFTFVTLGTTATMELSVSADALDPNKVYYLSMIPKDQNNILWEISNELRFKLSNQTSGEWVYTGGTAHAAAWADMNLANVTETHVGNRVTLRWTAIDGSDSVDIFLFNPTTATFVKLATVDMSAETYTFTTTRNGEHIINFMPNNGGREKRYTFTIAGTTPTTTTNTIKKVPHVGPAENLLVAGFIAFVLYLLYRRSTAHRK